MSNRMVILFSATILAASILIAGVVVSRSIRSEKPGRANRVSPVTPVTDVSVMANSLRIKEGVDPKFTGQSVRISGQVVEIDVAERKICLFKVPDLIYGTMTVYCCLNDNARNLGILKELKPGQTVQLTGTCGRVHGCTVEAMARKRKAYEDSRPKLPPPAPESSSGSDNPILVTPFSVKGDMWSAYWTVTVEDCPECFFEITRTKNDLATISG